MVERKLPVQQLTILSLARFAEPIALTSVFPYLPEMIESFGVPANEIAKWAGLTTGIFSLCQCLTGVMWGRASDKFGRKYVILLGLTNTMFTSLLWGFSKNLPTAFAARALAGAGNGNVGIIRTMVAEMCPWKELQPRAFSIMPLVWNIGSIFGPAFGGALSNPLHQDPRKPRGSRFLERFPYALPNVIAASLFFVGIVIGFLFLHETLESRKNKRDYGLILGQKLSYWVSWHIRGVRSALGVASEERQPLLKHRAARPTYNTVNDEEIRSEDEELQNSTAPATIKEVLTRQSVINLVVYTLLALYGIGYDQLIPVFMFHPPRDENTPPRHLPFQFANGFGLQHGRIGLLFTLYGGIGMLIQFFIFPPVARHYGVLKCLKVCTCVLPAIFFITPYTALLPNVKLQQGAIFVLMVMKGFCTTFMFPCNTILLTNSASSLRILGTLNGIATSVSAIGRAAGPALGGATFTLGVKHNLIIAPFWLFAAVALISAIPTFMLEEGEGFGADDDAGEDDTGSDIGKPEDRRTQTSSEAQQIPVVGNEAMLEAENSYGAPGPLLLSRTSTLSTAHGSYAIESDLDEDIDEPLQHAWTHPVNRPGLGGPSREVQARDMSPEHPRRRSTRRRSSVPIGGAVDFRRLSSNLGQSRSGYGTGTLDS